MYLTPPRADQAPLNALRAFEAAGRHGSFLRAAEELCVTPGAIAQQIKKLENWAGVELFERHPQGVTLTPLARRLIPELQAGFEALGSVSKSLRHGGARAEVRIASLPAIAQLWLGPRLSELQRSIPDADLAIHALDTPPLLERGDFDLAIYPADMLAAPHRPDDVLTKNTLVPVAAPKIADRVRHPEDLRDATLIHDLAWRGDWAAWLTAHGIDHAAPERGPTHSLYSMAVERCIAGDGILIGHTALIGQHLESGALKAIFPDLSVPGQPICLAQLPSDAGATDAVATIAAIMCERP